MSFTLRPSPAGYIEQLQRQRNDRGVLRVYLGYAAGTGKTYAMLAAARGLQAEGKDVLVGIVETHGRTETEAQVQGLPILPRIVREYRGRVFEEFDLDAALEQRPKILLVDELAHSNVGESRNAKRWQDVQELLEAGIEVHTTLNIQHIESMAEVVTQVSGVLVSELVPDHVLEEAKEIVLIDLPPETLLERLQAGKIYREDQARRAQQGFFQKTHLLALRELALRKVAQHVDEDARDHLRQQSLVGPWPAGERLLVCVGPSPYSERLVRATKRLADAMGATWIALHVDTGQFAPGQVERVDRHLQLAQRLGAEVVTETSHSLVDSVLQTAESKNVTKVVTGRTPRRPFWIRWSQPSLADTVLREAAGIDVLVLSGQEQQTEPRLSSKAKFVPGSYAAALLLVALATALGFPLADQLNPTIQVMLYLAAVVGSAYLHGAGPTTLASVLAVLAFNFFFVPPRFTLLVTEPSYWLTFFGLLFNGLLVSRLTGAVKAQSRSARLREADALTLLALSRELAQEGSKEILIEVCLRHLEKSFGNAVVLLADEHGKLTSTVEGDLFSEKEMAVAERAFLNLRILGKGTETLPFAEYQWHPLQGPTQLLGVAGLSEPIVLGARRKEDLLEAILNQVSAAFERRQLSESAQKAELLQASEKLRTALLNAISHDLRIPLVSIQGALTILQEAPTLLDEERRRAVIGNALSETDRLNRLVGNLLQKTRLETGHLALKLLPCDAEDLIITTLSSLSHRLEDRPLEVDISPHLPLVQMDFVLVAQVLTNLLENALAYSPSGSPIGVRAYRQEESLCVEVLDRGRGLDSIEPEHLFEKFERGNTANSPGLGLGLSICRGLVEAHNGNITGFSRDGGGAVFRFTLPMEASDAAD